METDKLPIIIPMDEIELFCKKWKVQEFAIFGSVLRGDFNQLTSDIDVLITFFPNTHIGWGIVEMKEELEKIFGKKVDLLEKRGIEKSRNPIKKAEILNSYRVIYEQAA